MWLKNQKRFLKGRCAGMENNYDDVIERFCGYINKNIIPSFRDYHPEIDRLVVTLNETLKNASAYEPYMPVKDRYDILDAALAFMENNPGMEITGDNVKKNMETLSDTYIILQLKKDMLSNIGFESMTFLKRNNIDVKLDNYDVTYSGKISSLTDSYGKLTRDQDYLDTIYGKFNVERPQDFKGRSLSVSDVVVLCSNHSFNAYYVDSIGCYKLDENFITRSEAVGMVDKWLLNKKEMNNYDEAGNDTEMTGRKIVNSFYKNMAEVYRNRAEKGLFSKDEMLSKARIYDFLATCTREDIINIYNSGAFNDITEAYARKALFFQQVDYNTAGNVIAEIKSLHDLESVKSVTDWNNETDSEKKWDEGIDIFNEKSDEYEL